MYFVWEWALQQHRAGEWAAALASYEAYTEARPDTAASYALQADCLLRLGKVDEAAAAWKKSEDAPSGSVEVMESLVCAVHREPLPVARRAELLARATGKGDVEAAADLIALDCDWPHDWWNAGPDEQYVKHDLDAVTAALKLPVDDARGGAIACAAACALADPEDAEAVRKALEKYGLVIDDGRTLPAHSGLRFIILHAATQSKVIELATVQKEIAPRLLEMARKTGDVKAWNTAVYFGPRDRSVEEALKIEREGWRATGDARFAAGTLLVKLKTGKLAGDDVELAAALKQFPESAMVWKIAYDVAKTEGKVTKELLAGAAKAEFTKFSSYVAPATVVNRPRAGYLRVYFAQLNRMAAAPAPPE
jgi:tetratricopeptide (TPR) repeat protein